VELLRDWLMLPLADRKSDLDTFFHALESPRELVVHNWKKLRPYAQYVPVQALKPEREMFLGDLEILIEIIGRECGADAIDPGAPRFQPLDQ
jgi:hypothetical protein